VSCAGLSWTDSNIPLSNKTDACLEEDLQEETPCERSRAAAPLKEEVKVALGMGTI